MSKENFYDDCCTEEISDRSSFRGNLETTEIEDEGREKHHKVRDKGEDSQVQTKSEVEL